MFEYYATGKTLPKRQIVIACMIGLMTTLSAYFVWYVSQGDGTLFDMSSWNGADQYAFGSLTIIAVGLMGMAYVLTMVKSEQYQCLNNLWPVRA